MPRPSRFNDDDVLDAALAVITARGASAMSVESIASEMGGNVGSIYYRFPSKGHLLALLWLRCAARGQAGMIQALHLDGLDDAVTAAALHYPRWARTSPAEARILAAHERTHLLPEWPDELADELADANRGLVLAIGAFTQRWYGSNTQEHRQATTFALLDIPVAAIRRFLLSGKTPPVSLDAHVAAAARAALESH